MKLRSAGVWALQVAGGARWQPRIRGRDPDRQGVVGHLLDTYGVAGRHFVIFRAPSVRISPEVPRTVRNAPGNVTLSRSRPIIPALSESCPTTRAPSRSRPETLRRNHATTAARNRRHRPAGSAPPAAPPQPDRSAAKSSSPSHRHPRSRCAGYPLPCNRPPDRRSCLSAQSARDCIQPN